MSTNLHDAAMEWAGDGFAIFPCIPGSKTPACFWRREATNDLKKVNKWWTDNPKYNIGLPTGNNYRISKRIEVLDVDVKNGNDGRWLLDERIVKRQMDNSFALVITPSGGYHYYFKSADQPSGKLSGVDFKANGGYVLIPPSEIVTYMPDGHVQYVRNYEFIRTREATPNDEPFDWDLVRRTYGPTSSLGEKNLGARQYPIETLARFLKEQGTPGNRNNELFRMACIAIESGYRELTPLYLAALEIGLEPSEIEITIKSAGRTYGINTN